MARISRLVGPIAFVLFGLGVALHGKTLTGVTVSPLEGTEEVEDGGVLGIGTGDPDYRLDVRVGKDWRQSATHQDKPMGDGLYFAITTEPPKGIVTSMRLVEDDAANDDVLDEALIEGGEAQSTAYRYEIEHGWSLGAGIEWFLGTTPGILLMLIVSASLVIGASGLALRGTIE